MESYIIEIYETRNAVLAWYTASQHTLEEDRSVQYQRFLDSGILPQNLRNKE